MRVGDPEGMFLLEEGVDEGIAEASEVRHGLDRCL